MNEQSQRANRFVYNGHSEKIGQKTWNGSAYLRMGLIFHAESLTVFTFSLPCYT